MLDNGIIESSTGPWASPIVLVRKKDGGVRLCIDLNQNTQKDAQPFKPSKCHLLQTSVCYLGHVVSAKGVETDPEKI